MKTNSITNVEKSEIREVADLIKEAEDGIKYWEERITDNGAKSMILSYKQEIKDLKEGRYIRGKVGLIPICRVADVIATLEAEIEYFQEKPCEPVIEEIISDNEKDISFLKERLSNYYASHPLARH